MSTSSDERNPVEALAEEFLDRKRRGEQPTLREYVERYPDLAEDIRDLFPALLMMEDLGESSGGTTGSLAADNGAAVGARLQRLGDYRILREIGRGGMGLVYEAEQESLGRRVALKVLSASSLLDPKQLRRFEREAKAAARLHHTNIVPVFGVGRQDGHHYFVMQFIAGLGLDVVLDDLRRLRGGKSQAKPTPAASRVAGLTGADVARSLLTGRFDADGPAEDASVTEPLDEAAPAANGPPADSGVSSAVLPGSSELSASSDPDRQFYRSVARIGVQVAEALEYANRQGILHRDVKPSNLLLDNHGNVWVADFGLAKTAEADDLTHTGDILGTIRYMAPERFQGRCDARSDVYSLGLTLYELVALRPAYEAADRHTLMERVLHEEPDRLRKLAPGVPRDLETIIAKATARDPVGRYGTAAALAEDLKRFVEDRPIRARRVSSAERFARWCRRNPVIAGSLGLAALALVAVAVMALTYAQEQRRFARQQSLRVAEQAEANKRITGLASNLEKESGRLKTSLAESNRRLAMLDLERGRIAFEKGQIGVGMLWTVESMRMAEEAGDADGRHVALANLAAWRRSLEQVKEVFPHGDGVTALAFSPDGKTILTGSLDKTAQLWNVASGKPIGRPILHEGWVRSAVFSPDGRLFATGGNDKTARLWDAATCQQVGPALEHPGIVFSAAFSPDGKTLVTGCLDGAARLWGTASGRLVGQPMVPSAMVSCVAFSPNGKTILTGSTDGTAQIWDAATGRPVGMPMKHLDRVLSVAFNPDGKTILTGSWDKTARTWDAASGQPLGVLLKHSAWVNSVAFSPDGKTILTGSSDGTAQLWDAATGRPMGPPLEHPIDVVSVAFSPDARWILTVCTDYTARLWDAATRLPVGPSLPLDTSYGAFGLGASFSPDGRFLLTAGREGARLRELPLPLPDDLPRLSAWVKGVTGLELSERGSIHVLDRTAWQESRRRLEELGGPPPADPAPLSDPILFGDKPEARGDGWKEKGFWDRAQAAYAEAIHARPLNVSLRYAVVRFHMECGHLDRAAATLEEAFRMMPENFELGRHLSAIRLWMGDLVGWRKLNAELLDRFGRTNDITRANNLAWACSMGPDGAADPQSPIRLAEIAVRGAGPVDKPNCLNTLAWALFRAGRFDDAIRRVEEAIQIRRGVSGPDDWPLLAMAHHRLGHRDQARQLLARLREHEPSTDPSQFWHVLMSWRIVNREAEALILYDPIFPADPFAQ